MSLAVQVTFDAADPAAPGFWKRVLGYIEQPPPEGWDSSEASGHAEGEPRGAVNDQSAIVDPDGNGSARLLPEGPGRRGRTACTSTWIGRPGLDGDTLARLNERAEELVALGATRLYEMDGAGTLLGHDADRRATSSAWTDPAARRRRTSPNTTHISLNGVVTCHVVSTPGGSGEQVAASSSQRAARHLKFRTPRGSTRPLAARASTSGGYRRP